MAREKNRRKRESRVVDFIIVYVRVKEYGVWNDIKYNWKLKSMEAELASVRCLHSYYEYGESNGNNQI